MLQNPDSRELQPRDNRWPMAIAAMSAAAIVESGCTSPSKPLSPEGFYYTLYNVAGACIADGANVRASNPLLDSEGKPSNTEYGELVHAFDTNANPEDGVLVGSKYQVMQNPETNVCFDIADGEVPVTITKRSNGENRYWYTFSREELEAQVGSEKSIAMKALVQAAIDRSLQEVVIASDGVSVAGKLGKELELKQA